MENKEELSGLYKYVCNKYADEFLNITEFEGEWNDDYSMWITEDEGAWDIEEIRYVVDNFDKLSASYDIRKEMLEWMDYVSDCIEFGIQYINLKSWFMGAKRLSKECRVRLRENKRKIDSLIDAMQNEYGELKNNKIPEHHNLKNG